MVRFSLLHRGHGASEWVLINLSRTGKGLEALIALISLIRHPASKMQPLSQKPHLSLAQVTCSLPDLRISSSSTCRLVLPGKCCLPFVWWFLDSWWALLFSLAHPAQLWSDCSYFGWACVAPISLSAVAISWQECQPVNLGCWRVDYKSLQHTSPQVIAVIICMCSFLTVVCTKVCISLELPTNRLLIV